MHYKALMCDVDGTLIPNKPHAKLSQKVITAITAASKKIHVGIATSRPPFAVSMITSQVQLSGPSIVNAGAQIIDYPSGKILSEHQLLQKDVDFLLPVLFKLGYHFILQDGKEDILPKKNENYTKILEVWIDNLTEKEIVLLTKHIAHLSTIFVHKVPAYDKNKFGIILTHAQATKQHGIYEVAKLLNISTHEVIGVGDGHNDFPLLMACGLKIAMGNAVDDLKAIADYVAPTVEEDGIADVIQKFILSS